MARPAPKAVQPISLEQANNWWQGRGAKLLRPVDFGRSPEWKGLWYAQLQVPRADKKPFEYPAYDLTIHFFLPDTPAVRGALRSGKLPAGSVLNPGGWRVERINRLDTNVLPVRLAGDSADGEIQLQCNEYRTMFSGANDCSPEGVLQRGEPYLRAHFFTLSQADSAAAPSRAAGRAGSGIAAVRMLSASVQPARVAAGGEVQLVLTYQVDGVAGPSMAKILERRIITKGGVGIADLHSDVPRPSGTFTSQQAMRVPASASPGVYSLRAEVSLGNVNSFVEALFEVQ